GGRDRAWFHPRVSGREERAGRIRFPVRRRFRRPYRDFSSFVLQGARPLQPGRRRGAEWQTGGAPQALVGLSRPESAVALHVRAAGAPGAGATRTRERRSESL